MFFVTMAQCAAVGCESSFKALKELGITLYRFLFKLLALQKTSSKNICEKINFTKNFHKIQGFAYVTFSNK